MTEAPMHPAPEPVSKDVTAKDIANLYSRIHNLIETVKEPQQKATAALAAPAPVDPTTAAGAAAAVANGSGTTSSFLALINSLKTLPTKTRKKTARFDWFPVPLILVFEPLGTTTTIVCSASSSLYEGLFSLYAFVQVKTADTTGNKLLLFQHQQKKKKTWMNNAMLTAHPVGGCLISRPDRVFRWVFMLHLPLSPLPSASLLLCISVYSLRSNWLVTIHPKDTQSRNTKHKKKTKKRKPVGLTLLPPALHVSLSFYLFVCSSRLFLCFHCSTLYLSSFSFILRPVPSHHPPIIPTSHIARVLFVLLFLLFLHKTP
jgi:hypothetical protein